jgi:KAP family P-loop domain
VWPDNETAIDSLNVQHVVQAILHLLDLPHLSPVTIGVYGDWGSGKSSVVLMLKEELESKPRATDTLCVVFNGWRFDGYDDAKAALMTTILEENGEAEDPGRRGRRSQHALLGASEGVIAHPAAILQECEARHRYLRTLTLPARTTGRISGTSSARSPERGKEETRPQLQNGESATPSSGVLGGEWRARERVRGA